MKIKKSPLHLNSLTRPSNYKKGMFLRNFELLLLCMPALICYFLFSYLPMFGLLMAFKDYKLAQGIWGSKWIGLKNFEFLFKSVELSRIIRNTVTYSLTFIVVGLVLNVIIALLLNEIASHRRAIKYYQTTMIFPNFLSWVIVGYITYAVFNPSLGLFNQVREAIGLERIDVYMEASHWPGILIFVNMWKSIGMGSMFYFAALIGIDESLYEAAKIDGASRLQQIYHISIPGLVPLMTIMSILAMGSVFRGDFGLFYQIPRDVSLLYETTDIIDTYVFRGLQNSNYGMASAVGFVQSVIGLLLITITNAIVKRISPENSMF
ncbi:MAG: sugar ABC transporter permease [Ruminococcaceae bacterium]|nr:sugar ABC transporter permease [Oscillospiraceae bacterium]